jgi:hypothetical protein
MVRNSTNESVNTTAVKLNRFVSKGTNEMQIIKEAHIIPSKLTVIKTASTDRSVTRCSHNLQVAWSCGQYEIHGKK